MSAQLDLPLALNCQQWIGSAFAWLLNTFGTDILLNKQMLAPDYSYIPIKYTGDLKSAGQLAEIVCRQMDVNPKIIQLHIYQEGLQQVGSIEGARNAIFMQAMQGEKYSSGKYFGSDENGIFQIGLKNQIIANAEEVLAVLAHEIAHIKLLGERRIQQNNEPLTDLTALYFGLGVFGANMAFNHTATNTSWRISRGGYLSQMEWGYALALRTYWLQEDQPEWTNYLNPTVRSDFKKCLRYFYESEFELEDNEEPEPAVHPGFMIEATEEEEKPDALAADYQLALDYINEKKFNEAAPILYELALQQIYYKQVFSYAIYALVMTEDFAKAAGLAERYEPLHTLTDTDAKNAAFAYLRLKNYTASQQYYQKVIDNNPFDVGALNNAGFCLNRLEKFDEALPYFDEAIEYDPSLAFAYNNRGLAKVKCGKAEDGLRDIQYSLQLLPNNAYSYRNLGIYYLQKRDKKLALLNLNKAKELDPKVDEIDELIQSAVS